jgi:hypothetical protein
MVVVALALVPVIRGSHSHVTEPASIQVPAQAAPTSQVPPTTQVSPSSQVPPTSQVPAGGFVDPTPSMATGTVATTGTMLTPAITTAVVAEVWPNLVEAAMTLRLSVSVLATPNAANALESGVVCGCGVAPPTYTSLEVTAPAERAYPLHFLAELDQPDSPGGPGVQIVEFSKSAPNAPWLVAHVAGYGGFTHTLTSSMALDANPDDLAVGNQPFVELAQLFSSLRQSGTDVPGNLWDDTITGDTGEDPHATESGLLEG